MRIALQHAAVHVGAGIALVGVADDVTGFAVCRPRLRPLLPGRVPAAAPAAQAGGRDLLDHRFGRHGGQYFGQSRVTAHRYVVFDARRRQTAVVAQQAALLRRVEGDLALQFHHFPRHRVGIQKLGDDLAGRQGPGDDAGHVFRAEMAVEDTRGVDDCQRALLAEPVAAGEAQLHLVAEPLALDLRGHGLGDR